MISDHRSEADARETARLERARLEVIYGDGARAWRILVVRDDEIVVEENPHGGEEPRRRAAERAPRAQPSPQPVADAPPPPGEETPADGPPAGGTPGPVPDWVIARVEKSIARQRDRDYGVAPDDDPDAVARR